MALHTKSSWLLSVRQAERQVKIFAQVIYFSILAEGLMLPSNPVYAGCLKFRVGLNSLIRDYNLWSLDLPPEIFEELVVESILGMAIS